MQYVLHALDHTDDNALERRLEARPAHINYVDTMRDAGHIHYGLALLDETTGQMKGSIMIVEFDTRKELDEWLAQEPYVTHNVWQQITITPCQVGPSFVSAKAV